MGLLIRKLIGLFHKTNEWKEMEYFDEGWKSRISQMAKFIPQGASVVDYGCGKMWLKEYLSASSEYSGVDYQKRDESTIVCDFNAMEFPKISAQVAFVSGCLEYVEKPDWFVSLISEYHEQCVISYCSTYYFNDFKQRKNLGWKNHLSESELKELFKRHHMNLVSQDNTPTNNKLFNFMKGKLKDE